MRSTFFRNRTHRLAGLLVALLVLLALATSGAGTALADSGVGATEVINGGTLALSVQSSVTAPPVQLNGQDQNSLFTLPLDDNDPRGTGAGWKNTITSTPFMNGTYQLDAVDGSALTITQVDEVCDSGGRCTEPTNTVTYPLTVPEANPAPNAVSIFNAALNTGMGDFSVTPHFSIFVPANSYAGTYTSTLTLGLVTGP